jgi:hypothetical protein
LGLLARAHPHQQRLFTGLARMTEGLFDVFLRTDFAVKHRHNDVSWIDAAVSSETLRIYISDDHTFHIRDARRQY